jgi:hypothetical protein
MVCALYEPRQGFDSNKGSELFNLCERADVVILDWDLYGENGQNILPLIANLVDESQNSVPHHSRLLTIYSTKPELDRIASAVYDFLRDRNLEVEEVKGPATLIAGSTRLIVLGKAGVANRVPEIKALEVSEEHLADRVIDEFAQMHYGVLPSYALRGMASIRRNSKKVLDKFRSDMDGAFLLHRALVLSDEDAFDQLPELLAEELLAVMSDDQPNSDTLAQLAMDAINELALNGLAWRENVTGRPVCLPGNLVGRFLNGGEAAISDDFVLKDKDRNRKVREIHDALGCEQTNADKELAALFSVRTRYFTNKAPNLGFGSIVRWHSNGDRSEPAQFGFCLMPLCDGMRLPHGDAHRTSFPFWTLKKNTGAKGRGIVFKGDGNEYVSLVAVVGRPRDLLWMDSFAPGATGLVAANNVDGTYCFAGAAKNVEWVAQLKPAHAQRVANDIAQSFARVGVIEAEWLRLLTT